MSKYTKIPVKIPQDVKVEVVGSTVKVTGPKGSLERSFPDSVEIEIKDGSILTKNREKVETKFGGAIIGTAKSHIANMINGVQNGWSKKLEINGTGYRAEVRGNDLVLTVGYSHPVTVTSPAGIKFSVEKNVITVEGLDKDLVGLIAAKIKAVRRPDPYKGKGIRYQGEVLKLKPGKQAAKAGGSA
jgi:large subunit ribosomal protein L6